MIWILINILSKYNQKTRISRWTFDINILNIEISEA